jgi:Zn-dependent protease with chaperone function
LVKLAKNRRYGVKRRVILPDVLWTLESRTCPECEAPIDVVPEFTSWCPSCDWNVDPAPPRPPPHRLAAWWQRRQNRTARGLCADIIKGREVGHDGAALTATTVALAALVHISTAAVLAGLVAIALSSLWIVVKILVLPVLAAIFVAVQPIPTRRRRRSLGGPSLTRDQAPTLFGLLDEIGSAIGGQRVETIVASTSYNAAYFRFHRKPVVEIGMPLWEVLTPPERVALLAHEIGHGVNGDPRRTVFVGRALGTLTAWQSVLLPGVFGNRRYHRWRSSGSLEVIAPLLLFPATIVVGAVGAVLSLLAQLRGQRSEYYADEMAAQAASSPAAIALIDRLLVTSTVLDAILRSLRFTPQADPFVAARSQVDRIPEAEFERRRRLERRRLSRIDTSHPPSVLRADALRALPAQDAKVHVNSARSAVIEAELEPARRAVAALLRSRYGR